MVTGDGLRKAMAKFATGVILLTTTKPDGSVQAMTANAFASIALEPPLVMVSIGHTRNTHPHVKRNGQYAISVLRSDQFEAALYFSKHDEDRSGAEPVEFRWTEHGMPVVKDCLAFFDCKVVTKHEHGDHTVFVAEVMETDVSEGDPLIFYERALGTFTE